MEKCKAAILILLFISIFLQQTQSQEFGQNEAARTYKQEKERVHEVHCSRERSKAAWKVIEEYLMPFVERENYQISRKCRLHPSNDLFRDQEEHKIHVDINEWKCGYCRKSFRAEKYLDRHFDNRHYNLLNVNDGKCLADLCGALHCDFVMNSKSPKTKCNPAAAAKNHHLCEGLANSCFPLNQGPSASRLHELFLRQFCDAHTCSGKTKYFPKGGKVILPSRHRHSSCTRDQICSQNFAQYMCLSALLASSLHKSAAQSRFYYSHPPKKLRKKIKMK